MSNVAFVFPGQGTQHVGMGRELYQEFPEVRSIFDRAAGVLGFDVARLCFEGPQQELDLTVNTQVTILTMEMAVYELVKGTIPVKPKVAAGHSLGEYCALYASGAIDFHDTLATVKLRAQYHQEAVPVGQGAMAAIIGLDFTDVEQICKEVKDEQETVTISVLNAPKQLSISGHTKAVERVMAGAKEKKAMSVIKLPISVPCHSPLLNAASERLREALDKITIRELQIPVIPNCDPGIFYTRENARDLLQRQIKSPVRWQETVEKFAALGIDTIVEIGPKKTLSNLIKRIDKRFCLLNIGDPESFREALSFFETNKSS